MMDSEWISSVTKGNGEVSPLCPRRTFRRRADVKLSLELRTTSKPGADRCGGCSAPLMRKRYG